MLCRLRSQIKKVLPHRREYYYSYLFRRLRRKTLSEFLERLGITRGKFIFAHVAFGKLGYFPAGPDGLLDVFESLLGEEGTIAMPAFPFRGSMQDFVLQRPHFDVRSTPSRVGLLGEAFRLRPGVIRSVHPTHSVCARGRYAEEFVSGHEDASTPCGPETPFGRLREFDAWVLRLGTWALTLYHHVQELVEYPNLFLADTAALSCVDYAGKTLTVTTRIYRKKIPQILYLKEDGSDQKYSVHPHDFPLLFGGETEERLRADPARREVLGQLRALRSEFQAKGWLRLGEIGGCRCELFRAGPFLEYAVREQRLLLQRYSHLYGLSRLEKLLESGGYPQ